MAAAVDSWLNRDARHGSLNTCRAEQLLRRYAQFFNLGDSKTAEGGIPRIMRFLMLPRLVALHGQAVSVASVWGGVVDEQGAAISGALVRMSVVDTGVVYNSVSNADGIECRARGSFLTPPQWDANAIDYVASSTRQLEMKSVRGHAL